MPTHPLRQVGTKYLTNKIKTYVNNITQSHFELYHIQHHRNYPPYSIQMW